MEASKIKKQINEQKLIENFLCNSNETKSVFEKDAIQIYSLNSPRIKQRF